jgi:predicted glycoside hydrolase/deacetylase ChbG (UPF0249 family)
VKELVVNADDFGRSDAVNRGVAEAHERGIVTSASLMVCWDAADAAAAYARRRPRLGVGLHLDLGEWVHRGQEWVTLYERADLSNPDAVSEELDRQLRTFERLLDSPPTHIDSHQHVHLREPVREAVIAAASSLDVPVRRISPSIAYRGEFYGQTPSGEPFPQGITPENLARIVASVTDGVTELACHPGIASEGSPYGEERTRETAALTDPGTREAVDSAGVCLRSFVGLGFR